MDRSSMSIKQRGGAGSPLVQWLLQALVRWHSREPATPKRLELLETLPAKGSGYLMLVRCGGGEYLIGGGANSIETIVRVPSSDPSSVRERGELS